MKPSKITLIRATWFATVSLFCFLTSRLLGGVLELDYLGWISVIPATNQFAYYILRYAVFEKTIFEVSKVLSSLSLLLFSFVTSEIIILATLEVISGPPISNIDKIHICLALGIINLIFCGEAIVTQLVSNKMKRWTSCVV